MKSPIPLFVLICLTAIFTVPIAFADSTGVAVDIAAIDTATAVATDTVAMIESVIVDESGEQLYPMSPERHERLVSYSKFNSIWRFVSFFIGLAVLALILFTGLSARLRDWVSGIRIKFFAVWAFVALFLLADYILNLPFSIYRSFLVESDYGFMNQTFMEWLGEDLLGLLITAAFMIIPVWFFYQLVNKYRRWWLWFSLGAIPFIVLMAVIVPVLISPMFNEFGPLNDKQLEAEIIALAEQAGIEGANIYEVDASKQSSKINAYVTGLFGTKRIVLYDTLIKYFTLDEIKFVMAHEMGHYKMNHVWQGVGLAILFIMFALWLMNRLIHSVIVRFKNRFGFDSLSDYASWPLVLVFLTVIMFVFQPVTNSFSRHIERQADTYGMEMSGVDGEAAATAFDKLSVFNLSDPNPNAFVEFWFYSHPSLVKRMAFVRGWQPSPETTKP
ncbi:MAG: M48 family metallopeptidase [candidate division Zixibacteria bacterium]|nr:M48 family metallopeptidase [candidate division Zixibacteria bacterium]